MSQYAKPRIYADFNKWDGDDAKTWLILTCRGTFNDLAQLKIKFTEGLEAIFYCEDEDQFGRSVDLEADGCVHYDGDKKYWVAVVDFSLTRQSPRGG